MARVDLFPSFWMAGFDCASQIQRPHQRFDLTAWLQHDRYCEADYAMLVPLGIRTVRDGIRWHLIERQPRQYDFASIEPQLRAAERHGLLVIWDVCHYGCPDGLHLLHPTFPARFARFAGAFARYMREHSDLVPYYVPINEMSFLAYQAGEIGGFHPFAQGQGHAVRCSLVRAAIAAIEAIREADPRARIVHTEPLIHLVAPAGHPDLEELAAQKDEEQFAPLDMLAGRLEPQLGGHPRYLDILGFNFYSYNEADLNGANLTRDDPRWRHLGDLLERAYARYGRPFLIAETTGVGPDRGEWLAYVADQAAGVLERGLPLAGICLYPATSAPDWDTGELQAYGLCDLEPRPDGSLARRLSEPVAGALRAAQARLQPYLGG